MDDFSREFCSWDKLREQHNKIKTEIDNNIKNLCIKDVNNNIEYKSFTEFKTLWDIEIFWKKFETLLILNMKVDIKKRQIR